MNFPQTESTARICIHGTRVWFGHECGDCESTGNYIWDFDAALESFLGSIRELRVAYFAKNFPNLTSGTISIDPGGKKYLRVVCDATGDNHGQVSVYCFVEKSTGDILKADGWKRPAKHACGNIYDNAGKGAITPWGVHYINSGGHRD